MSKTIRMSSALAAIVLLAGAVGFAQSSGEATYKGKCQSCHGAQGVPNPGIAKAMGVKPASDPSVKAESEAQMITDHRQRQGQDAGLQGQAYRCRHQGFGGVLPDPGQVRARVRVKQEQEVLRRIRWRGRRFQALDRAGLRPVVPANISSACRQEAMAAGIDNHHAASAVLRDGPANTRSFRMKELRFLFVLAAVVSLAGAMCFAEDGAAIYKAKCAMCHGATGTPSAGMAKAMGIKPSPTPPSRRSPWRRSPPPSRTAKARCTPSPD